MLFEIVYLVGFLLRLEIVRISWFTLYEELLINELSVNFAITLAHSRKNKLLKIRRSLQLFIPDEREVLRNLKSLNKKVALSVMVNELFHFLNNIRNTYGIYSGRRPIEFYK